MEQKFSKLFAFDLDGTLVHDNPSGSREIPSSLLRTIFELSKIANIVVATGRRIRSSLPVIQVLPAMEFGVFHNGLIVRGREGEIHVHRRIYKDEITEVTQCLKELGQNPILVLDGHRKDIDFIFERYATFRDPDGEYAWKRSQSQGLLVERFEDIYEEYAGHFLEVACIGDYMRLVEVQKLLQAKLPDRLRSVVVRNCGYEGRSVLEVFDKAASKRSGIEYVKKTVGAQEVIAVGDDENDVEMLEWADVSISMGHALPHVRAKAQLEVDGPEGLERYLRETWLK